MMINDDQVQQGFHFLHFLHRGSFRLKVKEWTPGSFPVPLPDPDSYWIVILATSAMASTTANMTENEMKTLTGARATTRTITMLDTLRQRGVVDQLPAKFTLSHEGIGPISDMAVNRWLDSVKIPVVVVASLAFASRRRNPAGVSHALQLLTRPFRDCTLKSELDMSAETYIGHASRMMKVFVSKHREDIERQNFDLLCSPECAIRAEDLWSVLKESYALRRSHRVWKDREWIVPNFDNVERHRVGCIEYYSPSCQLVRRANPTRQPVLEDESGDLVQKAERDHSQSQ